MGLVHVVGMGLDGWLAPGLRELVARAEVVAGGRRWLELAGVEEHRALVMEGGVQRWFEGLEQALNRGEVVVLASGDPGLFGVGELLLGRLGRERVRIYPGVSAMQAAFARLGLGWSRARFVSLHARGEAGERALAAALMEAELVGVYTGGGHGPGQVSRLILRRGQGRWWRMWVVEELGGPGEKAGQYRFEEAAGRQFSPLNVVVLERVGWPLPVQVGGAEEVYEHERGMITKAEVRAVVLGKLGLMPGQVVWDLGAGCGSVGVEAAWLVKGGLVVAVEHDPGRARLVARNRERFGAACLELVEAHMPECLEGLPAPDRVFVGGGGPALEGILEVVSKRVAVGGRVVVAAVRLESLEVARRVLARSGREPEVVQVTVARAQALGRGSRLRPLNPVWLVCGTPRG